MASVRPEDYLEDVYQIRFHDGRRDPPRTTNSLLKSEYSYAEAQEEANWRQQLYDRGEFDPWVQDRPGELTRDEHVTVGEAIGRYVEDKTEAGRRGERRGWSESTAKRYRPTLQKFARDVGESRLLSHLTADDIRAFVYRDGLSDASKRTYYGMLRAWTSWLEDKGLPAPDMPPEIRTRQTLPSWCSREELVTIIRAFRHLCSASMQADSDPDKRFTAQKEGDSRWWMQWAWRFAFWQGLRRGEIVAIRCGGIDLEERVMVVGDETFIPKGQREDVIPLSEPAAKIAEEWGAGDRPADERLFRHADGEKISRAFTEARRQATGQMAGIDGETQLTLPEDARLDGGKDLTLHSLRHGRAIDLIKKRRHIVYVSQFLRHASLEMTREYLQVVPRHLQKEIRELEEEALDVDGPGEEKMRGR